MVHLHEGIVLVEDNVGDLGSNQAIRGLAFGQEPAQQRAAKLHSGIIAVRTSLVVGYTGAAPTVKEGGEKERYDAKVGKVVEDLLRCVRSIVVSYPGMVTADNEMGAAEVLPHDGMENRFPRAGIAHLGVESGQHRAFAQVIMLHERLVGP